jgi:hypothetical protein
LNRQDSMNTQETIDKSESLIQWLDKQIDGLQVSADSRLRLSVACLDMALEHQKAIVLLVANKLCGSAFSLIRLEFESYVRGVWLQLCASESEIEKFKNDKLKKTLTSLIQDIENCDGFEEGILSAAKTENWIAMNSFTHCGYLQAARRNKEESIEPNYTEKEIIELLNITNALGMLSALQIVLMADKKELASKMIEKSKLMFENTL